MRTRFGLSLDSICVNNEKSNFFKKSKFRIRKHVPYRQKCVIKKNSFHNFLICNETYDFRIVGKMLRICNEFVKKHTHFWPNLMMPFFGRNEHAHLGFFMK